MKQTLLDTVEDMTWVWVAHLPKLDKKFDKGAAVLFGNEDLPKKIHVYESNAPLITDDPLIFTLDPETLDYTGTKWE